MLRVKKMLKKVAALQVSKAATFVFVFFKFFYFCCFSNMPMAIFSLVIGRDLIYKPVALYTALAKAGAGVFIGISPIDFAPKGPVGS